jgi:hypothetical protein
MPNTTFVQYIACKKTAPRPQKAGKLGAVVHQSQASIADLNREFGVDPKTVAKWRRRKAVEDQNTGPKEPRSTVLSEDEEAMIVAFRRHTLLPLDECPYAVQPSIPRLTRISLHRCLPPLSGKLSPSFLKKVYDEAGRTG